MSEQPLNAGAAAGVPYFDTTLRPRYEETDQMGVIYHTNYLVYFEVGRTDLLRGVGCPYSSLEREGRLLAVTDCGASFHRPAHYDEPLTIRTRMPMARGARVRLEYEVLRTLSEKDESELPQPILLVSGFTEHAWIKRDTMRPTRPPAAFVAAVKSFSDQRG